MASHGHDWVPVGLEKAQDGGGTVEYHDDIQTVMTAPTTHWYVVIVCRGCDVVLWQEYDPAVAREAVRA